MSKLVTVFGGSGFVGRYVVRRMAKAGWRVRVAVRRPNEALFTTTSGVVGQVEPVQANIRDDASVAAAIESADVVINCVGILTERGKNQFDPVQHDGAERIARLTAAAGISTLVHVSAIGADSASESDYLKSKGLGEEGVLAHFPDAVILRPSVIFGAEDEFFNRFARMATMSPIIPIAGAGTKFQPVFVDDVAAAAETAALGGAKPGVYELGGPDTATFRDLMKVMLGVIQRRRLVLNMPGFVARIMAGVLGIAQFLTAGLFHNGVLTSDQLKSLAQDNVVGDDAMTLADLGVQATSMEAVLPSYLWSFRPSGQYAALKNSAKNLKA